MSPIHFEDRKNRNRYRQREGQEASVMQVLFRVEPRWHLGSTKHFPRHFAMQFGGSKPLPYEIERHTQIIKFLNQFQNGFVLVNNKIGSPKTNQKAR